MNKRLSNKIKKSIEKLGFKTFDGDYGLSVSDEVVNENDEQSLDYYGEFRGGYPWINPELVKVAEDNGCYWEWANPGSICLSE